MKSYTIKLHEDDVERLCMLKMEMQQDDSNDDWDMICDIFQQIENQRFEELVYKTPAMRRGVPLKERQNNE